MSDGVYTVGLRRDFQAAEDPGRKATDVLLGFDAESIRELQDLLGSTEAR
jgi:hypothetical protein